MSYNNDKPGRRSIRLEGYDYTQQGAYFVTICTYGRERLFGAVVAGKVVRSPYGDVVAQCWGNLAIYFPSIVLDAFVVMPNHIHSVIVNTQQTLTLNKKSRKGTHSRSLGAVVQNFKSVSTRKINQLRSTAGVVVWQRNYYEQIIRDAAHLENVSNYVATNPLR